MGHLVKVLFELPRESENWPPTATETMWAESLGNHHYRVDNIPAFAVGLAFDDIIEAKETDHFPEFIRVVRHSGNSTYRLIKLASSDSITSTVTTLKEMGCDTENFGIYKMIFLNVPPTTDVAAVYELLESLHDLGLIDFEEGFYWDPGASGRRTT